MIILNFTQHDATPEQLAEGVVEIHPENRKFVRGLLTFNELPSRMGLKNRARLLVDFAEEEARALGDDATAVMIGSAPYFTPWLEAAMQDAGFKVLYSFKKKIFEEEIQADGSVRKNTIYRHEGFVEAR